MTRRAALVLASGGIDSSVALYWARGRYGRVRALAFDYPGRPRGERRALAQVCRAAGLPGPTVCRAPDWVTGAGAAGNPPGYITAKNLVFYALAAAYAERHGFDDIVGGHTRDDSRVYRDARRPFFDLFGRLLAAGRPRPAARPPRLVMPLLTLSGRQTAALGRRLGAPIEATWSCQEDGPRPCRRCRSCRAREAVLAA